MEMKYANHISEMINAFSPAPLQREQMKEFYCEDTMEYRTSDKYDSPIKDIFAGILNIFAKIKTDLKYNEETRKEYRKRISVRSSEWIGILGCVAEEISKKKEGKRLIIIFEDLDKLNPEDAWKVILSQKHFP
ncbi:hypothetical protein [Roseburia sp. 1XD42-69]|uniref:hypothetical protein n=1 Tax=Roseburia sp. 1XD42-69 TaxID=2320088 RepID=UPI000EA31379|nr:hypothetical protein [Roseburia sp. 1XD42-69]RKJ65320.1 hypothetical protein D7Y06_10000 [Roseburia sp. 1XD42-69]